MNIVWNIVEDNREVKALLVYNIYLGTKKLYIDNVEILKIKGFNKNPNITFKYNNKDCEIQLIPDDYGYIGFLVTSDGDKISAQENLKKKTPLWIIPFVIINMAIPIVSVEALTTWIIGIVASYIIAKVSQGQQLSIKKKIAISIGISILAWAMYYIFYFLVISKNSSSKGLLPF